MNNNTCTFIYKSSVSVCIICVSPTQVFVDLVSIYYRFPLSIFQTVPKIFLHTQPRFRCPGLPSILTMVPLFRAPIGTQHIGFRWFSSRTCLLVLQSDSTHIPRWFSSRASLLVLQSDRYAHSQKKSFSHNGLPRPATL